MSPMKPSASTTASTRYDLAAAWWYQIAEEVANRTATASTVFGPPSPLSNGMSSRQPPEAPNRSKKYTRSTRVIVSEITREIMVPEKKKGSALTKYVAASV